MTGDAEKICSRLFPLTNQFHENQPDAKAANYESLPLPDLRLSVRRLRTRPNAIKQPPLEGGEGVDVGFAPTADSSRVVYYGDLNTDEVFELYSASTTLAGTQVLLTNAGSSLIGEFQIAPNSEFVVYKQFDPSTSSLSLWYVDIMGSSAPAQIAYSTIIGSYSILADSSGILFSADLSTFGTMNLYSTVPEPSTWALASLGLAVSLWRLRRRK